MFPLLVTLLVFVLAVLWSSRFRYVARWWNPVPTLRDRAFDLAELDLPPGWRPAQDLSEGAGIEAVDLLHNRYVAVMSHSRDDFDARLSIDAFAVQCRDSLTSAFCLLNVRGPEQRTIGGCPAVQFEIEGVYQRTELWYLHTTIMGHRAFHEVTAWALRSSYKRQVFEDLLKGFRERPGDPAQPRVYPTDSSSPVARRIGFRPEVRAEAGLDRETFKS